MAYTVQQIDKAFESISEAQHKAMSFVSVDKVMQELSSTHKITLEKMSQISGQITFVLIGLAKAGEFYDSIKSQTGLPDEVLIKLVDDINKKIFIPFRQAMIAFSYEPEPEEAEIEPEVENNPSIRLNFTTPDKTVEQNDRTILKSTDIEIEEDIGESVRTALDDADANKINRNELLRTLENPPKSEGSIKIQTQFNPVVVGMQNVVSAPRVQVPQNIVPPPISRVPQNPANTQPTQTTASNPASALSGIVGSKLQATFKIPKETSDYTVPSISDKKISDPYREAV